MRACGRARTRSSSTKARTPTRRVAGDSRRQPRSCAGMAPSKRQPPRIRRMKAWGPSTTACARARTCGPKTSPSCRRSTSSPVSGQPKLTTTRVTHPPSTPSRPLSWSAAPWMRHTTPTIKATSQPTTGTARRARITAHMNTINTKQPRKCRTTRCPSSAGTIPSRRRSSQRPSPSPSATTSTKSRLRATALGSSRTAGRTTGATGATSTCPTTTPPCATSRPTRPRTRRTRQGAPTTPTTASTSTTARAWATDGGTATRPCGSPTCSKHAVLKR